MNVILIAGSNNEALKENLQRDGDISVVRCERNIGDAFKYLRDNRLKVETLLLLDQGVDCSTTEFEGILSGFRHLMSSTLHDIELKFITKEPEYEVIFKQVAGNYKRLQVHLVDQIRVPVSLVKEVCLQRQSAFEEIRTQPLENKTVEPEQQSATLSQTGRPQEKRTWSIFKGLGSSQSVKADAGSRVNTRESDLFKFEQPFGSSRKSTVISSGLNRLVGITGHRGSGVTSTVANLAVEGSMQGLKTIVIDLDTQYRAINLYFNKFGDEVDLNPDLATSLIKCLLKPDSFSVNSCRINENLSVVTLAYSVDSKDKLMDFITAKRLLSLVTVLKPKFNLVLLDAPLSVFIQYPDLLIHMDSLGLCVGNSLYSIINTVKSISDSFDKENLTVIQMKAKVIVTKYNDNNRHQGKKVTPEFTCEILSNISETFDTKLDCAGLIPYNKDFDLQVDSGKKICSISEEYKKYYLGVLNGLM